MLQWLEISRSRPHRGFVDLTHSIKGSTSKEECEHVVLVYRGEKELKEAAGFERPDDACLLAIDSAGAIQWRYHGAVTDQAVEQIAPALNKAGAR